jgi:hypothetical protein
MKENDENKSRQGRISTCFEGSPCAEMMQMLMDEQGVGPSCEEMMKTWMKKRREAEDEAQAARDGKIQSNGGVK